MRIPILLVLILFCLSCNSHKSDEITYYSNGNINTIKINNKIESSFVEYNYYENGNIKEIHRYNKNGDYTGEQVWFNPDGLMDEKGIYQNGFANGNGYFFYDTTGSLKSHRYYRNDKQVFRGADYWEDSIGIIKRIIYFNDSGRDYYQKIYDSNGNFIYELGKK